MRRKVMFMIPTLGSGGAENILINVLDKIDKSFFDITLIVLQKYGENLKKLTNEYKVIFINERPNYIRNKLQVAFIKYFPAFYYKLIIKDKYDVEIAYLEGLATKLISNSNNKLSKKIAWIHCDFNKYNWVKKYFKNKEDEKVYKKFDELIFVSKQCKKSFEKIYRNNVKKKVIYNPIIDERIKIKSKEKNISYDKTTILAIGSLSKVKGFERLIEAHRMNSDLDYNIKIIGEGGERRNLEMLIKKYELNSSFELLGYKSNPYPYMKAADIIVSSSYSEAYPTVLLEAIILSKPIIATNVEGNNEVLENGKIGMLCNDTFELAENIRKMVLDKRYIDRYSELSLIKSRKIDYKLIIKEIEECLI